ncbi:MAG: SWIM zinc finger family protein [Gammaproteobacteria bacterium]|nr:SWIM zinc finger family protein [Gammaproteobacteria bacterium]
MDLNELTFLVKGSSADPYELTFIKDGDSLTALCSCPAGQYGNFCKHRIAILDGNGRAIVSENAAQLSTVVNWLQGTDVEAALTEFRNIEKSADAPKSALVTAKRKLARAMNS